MEALFLEEMAPPPPAPKPSAAPAPQQHLLAPGKPKPAPPPSTAWEKNFHFARLRRDWPTRPRDWRWQKACLMVEANDDISRIQDEPIIVDAVIRLQASPPPRDPDLVRHQVCEEILGAALSSLGEIEAYLISREPLANTARRFAVQETDLEHYAALFFDVLNEPIDSSWVRHHAIGSKMYPCPSLSDRDLVLKVMALAGPYVLEKVIWCLNTPAPTIPKRLSNLPTEELLRIQSWMTTRQLIHALTYQPKTPSEQLRFEMLCADGCANGFWQSDGIPVGGPLTAVVQTA